MNKRLTTHAAKILADILNQPVDSIFCELLKGGTEEDIAVKCRSYDTTDYVIKLFKSPELGKNEIEWTRLASDLQIGPKLFHADSAGNYMIMAFAQGTNLVPATANMSEVIKSLVSSLSRLHQSAASFARPSDMFSRIETKYKKLNSSGQIEKTLEDSRELVEKIKVEFQEIPVALVPCHNDLNPGNIYVLDHRITLIDWGDSALGNPYYDIAAFFVLNVIEPNNEKLFFEQYDAKMLLPEWQRYMQLCKQLVHFEFALNLLLGVQAGKRELLHEPLIPQVKPVSFYLTQLAERNIKIDSEFLYHMASASLAKMK